MSDVAIQVENLGKMYRIGGPQARYKRFTESVMDTLAAPLRRLRNIGQPVPEAETLWALKDVSFEVKQGEVVGIIGRNGAGKSTLLKILSRITEPTEGEVRLHGRVGSLLEVGTGFHPELTGRENIYLNGTILGMKRAEIDRKFDEIVAFAEIEKFLDTPVKRYSSGMYVRLAFAVAAHLEPEILVVDEVLAVGDVAFQKKCLGKMGEVAQGGRTVLFVSHNMGAIQSLCRKSLLLFSGQAIKYGQTEEVISYYLRKDFVNTMWVALDGKSQVANPYFDPLRIQVVDKALNLITSDISADSEFGILIEGNTETINSALTVGLAIYASGGELLFWTLQTDTRQEEWPELKLGTNRLLVWLPCHFLNEGDYRIELIVSLHFQAWISQPGVNAPGVQISIKGGLSESPYWMLVRPGLLAPILKFKSL